MPYVRHPKHETPDPTIHPTYTERQQAHAERRANETVVYVATAMDTEYWHYRESSRFLSGPVAYRPVPWVNHRGYCGYYDDSIQARERGADRHYAHMSTKTPGLIAYTPTPEHGYQDRQVTIRPGKYLAEFYSDVPMELRQAWIAICQDEAKPIDVRFTTSPDECERVYRGCKYGGDPPFQSCMGPDSHTDGVNFAPGPFPWKLYPTRVYGTGELAIAYLGDIDACIARVLVWPAKKIHINVRYGESIKLKLGLERLGYTAAESSAFVGARIGRICHPQGGLVVPYCDVATRGEEAGEYLILGKGYIDLRRTNGRDDDVNDDQDDEPAETMICEHCYRACERNEDSSYCDACENDRQYCEGCDSDTWDTMIRAVSEDRLYLSTWDSPPRQRREEAYRCQDCRERTTCVECDEEWYEWDLMEQEQLDRIAYKVIDYCEDCAEIRLSQTVCHACQERYNGEEYAICPACAIVPRCTLTLALPFDDATAETMEVLF